MRPSPKDFQSAWYNMGHKRSPLKRIWTCSASWLPQDIFGPIPRIFGGYRIVLVNCLLSHSTSSWLVVSTVSVEFQVLENHWHLWGYKNTTYRACTHRRAHEITYGSAAWVPELKEPTWKMNSEALEILHFLLSHSRSFPLKNCRVAVAGQVLDKNWLIWLGGWSRIELNCQ